METISGIVHCKTNTIVNTSTFKCCLSGFAFVVVAISHAFPLLKFLPLSHLPIAGKKVNGAAVSRQALGFYLTSES